MDHSHRDQEKALKALAAKLLSELRRAAGVDLSGEPVRLGERDSDGYLVGYVDDEGGAWESLGERLVATAAGRLVDALALPEGARRDGLIEAAISELPDELLVEALRQAAFTLVLRRIAGD